MNALAEPYIVVPALDSVLVPGSRHAFASRFDPSFDVAARSRLFVPLDESTAARRVLGAAIALALPAHAAITLLACADGNAESSQLLSQVLLPAQAAVEGRGLRCDRRLLDGEGRLPTTRALIAESHGGGRLVLGEPLRLKGSLRELTAALLCDRPCALYVLALDDNPLTGLRVRLGRWRALGGRRRLPRRHGEMLR